MVTLIGLLIISYILGSIPTGYVVARLQGLDIRRHGSGNIGATNVMRTLGLASAITVAAVDVAKAAVPALAAQALRGPEAAALAGVAAMVGHMYPFTLGFRGGKGVATGLGFLLVVDPFGAGLLILAFAATAAATRFVSVGSMLATVIAPCLLWWRGAGPGVAGIVAGAAVLVLWRHLANLRRLRAGTESRLGQRADRIDQRPASGE